MKGAWAQDWSIWGGQFPDLMGRASDPYDTFVYGAQAQRVGRALWAAGRGEFAPPHCRAWVIEGQLAGGLAGLRGDQVGGCRLQAALILRRAGLVSEEVRQRAQRAATALVRPQPDDYYLSRLAVAPPWQKQGVGRWLLTACEEAGRRSGCRRVVLEAVDRAQLEGFYRCFGYRVVGRGQASENEVQLSYVHWAKELD
ncbi:MAG: GNAT family N-acetyltransferase [Candidatus Latescibacteria bacterium]|nr:GNAT family N-acetyltransferase [Candidatus Latescibacterota bacterium]